MTDTNNPIRAVAFDMDGLMFNSEDIYDIVGSRLLESRGQKFSRELKSKMMGLPGNKALAVLKEFCGLDDNVESLVEESNEIYLQELPDRLQMMPGLEKLLTEVENRNLPKVVVTSSHRNHATFALGKFDLEKRFEFVLTSENVVNGKPAPDIYALAAEKLGVATTELLALEDSFIGSSAASAAGTLTVAVPNVHSVSQNFDHVDYVVDRLDSDVILMLLNR